MRPSPVAILLLAISGCGPAREKGPGDSIGRYSVTATLSSSSCGDGVLHAPDPWQFDVRLSRDGLDFWWLNGTGAVGGHLGSDAKTFEIGARSRVQIAAATATAPECVVFRDDHATGEMQAASAGFSGELSYAYAPAEGSDCTALVGKADGVAALPCSIEYTMTATRIAD